MDDREKECLHKAVQTTVGILSGIGLILIGMSLGSGMIGMIGGLIVGAEVLSILYA